MSITRKLMNIGSFRLELQPDTPRRVRAAIAGFDHIVITDTQLDPIGGFSDASILAASRFTGVVIDREDSGRIIRGADLGFWLGTRDGIGDLLDTAISQTSATLSSWVSALVPASLTVGTVTNTGLSTLTNTYYGMSRREALDSVCRAVSRAEWRVNPNFTVDAADPEILFRFDPTVVITRKPEGRDSGVQGLEASEVVMSESFEGYTTRAIVVANGMRTGSASTTPPYYDGRNNLVVMERFVNAPDEDPVNAINVAGTVVDQYAVPRTELRLRSNTYSVSRFASPGDWVYVYDADAGISDPANQINFRGELVTPRKLRVYGITHPIQRGMGVYARRSTGSGYTWTDLTSFVRWEDGEVEWEVGAGDLPLTGGGVQGATARLGDNAAVVDRGSLGGPWQDWAVANGHATDVTAAIGSSGGGTNWGTTPSVIIGRVTRAMPNDVRADLRIRAGGSSISAGLAGNYRINLPYPANYNAPGTIVGHGFALNAANTIMCPFQIVLVSSTQAEMYYPATHNGTIAAVTNAAPFALASGDTYVIHLDYEAG